MGTRIDSRFRPLKREYDKYNTKEVAFRYY